MMPLIACAPVLLAFATGAAPDHKYLTVGDPAPSLSSAIWIKGQPQGPFEKGKTYVVEFWATWCSPCKANIPKLTDLAAKYKDKVSVDGISVWEATDAGDSGTLAKVKGFVAGEGSKMEYNVAADTRSNTVADRWLTKAGEGSLPTTFIVDGTGEIAWIGHGEDPSPVLDAVLAGKWNVADAKKSWETEKEFVRPVKEALDAKHYEQALESIKVSVAKRPQMKRYFEYDRLVCLFHTDLNKAKEESLKALSDANSEIGVYQMTTSIAASQEDLSPSAYQFGLDLTKQALEKNDRKYLFLSIEAAILGNLHRPAEAAKTEQLAIDAAGQDSHAPAPFIEFLRRNLAKYQKESG